MLFNTLKYFAIFSGISILSLEPTFGEYVVYKTKTTKTFEFLNTTKKSLTIVEPTPAEFRAAYEIILKYKWPTNIYTFFTDPNINLQQDEEKSIKKEMGNNKKLKNIKISFIPTIIYEAAFLAPNLKLKGNSNYSFLQQILDTNEKGRIIDIKILEVIKELKGMDEETQHKAILKYMYNLNMNPIVISKAMDVNKSICDIMKEDFDFINTLKNANNAGKHRLDIDEIPLAHSIYRYFQQFDNKKASWNQLLNRNISKDVIKKVARLEAIAHKKNEALLFRGATQDSPIRLKSYDDYERLNTPEMQQRTRILKGDTQVSEDTTNPFSISYGFSLMAGMAFDSGGNAYNYAMRQHLGYALSLDKNLFFDRNAKSPRDLFWIPPFGTIVSLHGIDDLFHPRTTIGLSGSIENLLRKAKKQNEPGFKDFYYNPSSQKNKLDDVEMFLSFFPIVWVIGIDKNTTWESKALDLANYISSHAVAFYDPKGKIKSSSDILNYFNTEDLLFLKDHQKKFESVVEDLASEVPTLKKSNLKGPILNNFLRSGNRFFNPQERNLLSGRRLRNQSAYTLTNEDKQLLDQRYNIEPDKLHKEIQDSLGIAMRENNKDKIAKYTAQMDYFQTELKGKDEESEWGD